MVNDPIADFITSIKNATAVKKRSVHIPHSKLKMVLAEVLSKEGFVGAVSKRGRKVKKTIEIQLLYPDGKPRIQGARRISRLSARTYVKAGSIRPVKNGFGRLLITTPKGVLTGGDARKYNVGGEPLFSIW